MQTDDCSKCGRQLHLEGDWPGGNYAWVDWSGGDCCPEDNEPHVPWSETSD